MAERFFPSVLEVFQGNRHAVDSHIGSSRRLADEGDVIPSSPCSSRSGVGFDEDRTIAEIEQFLCSKGLVDSEADAIAEGHLSHSRCDTALTDSMHRFDFAIEDSLMEEIAMGFEGIEVRHFFAVTRQVEEENCVIGSFKFRRDDIFRMFRCNGERNERRRNGEVFKGTAHAIFPADSSDFHDLLGRESTEEGADRLAPGFFIRAQALEKFLHGQVDFLAVAAEGNEFGNGLDDGIEGTVEGAPNSQVRIIAVRKDAGCRRVAVFHGNLGNHAFDRCLLVLAAKGHEDRAGTDGAVEAFSQALFRGDIQGPHRIEPGLGDIFDFRRFEEIFIFRSDDDGFAMLGDAVGIEESAGNIDDVLVAPMHDQAFRIGSDGDDRRFQVFFSCVFHKFIDVFRSDDDGHTFLRFGNSQFRTVQAFVLLRDFVEIDVQAVRQFTDSDGDTAGTEVVAAFDEDRNFMAAEEALDLAFRQGIALLDFGAACFQGFDGVLLGRTRSTAAAVAAGLAAEEDDDIARKRFFTDDIIARCSAEDSADFHTFGDEAGVVIFLDFARSQADLVAIGAVALGSACRQFALRQFADERIFDRLARVAGTGDAHSLIDIGTAAQGIADTAAQAGSRTAERFDFRWVVMGFIFEEEEPFFFDAIDIDRDDDSAGVDFFRFVEIVELAGRFQFFDGNGRHIHEGLRFLAVQVFPGRLIRFISALDRRREGAIFKGNISEFGHERRVTAVVRPVRIDDADFCNRRIAFFFIPEVGLDKFQIVEAHSQAHVRRQFFQSSVVHGVKTVDDGNVSRFFPRHFQRRNGIQRSFAGFDGVDAIMFDCSDVIGG